MWKKFFPVCCCLFTLLSAESSKTTDNYSCPTWSYWDNSSQSCTCGHAFNQIVSCKGSGNDTTVGVIDSYCITLDSKQSSEVLGPCLYNFKHHYFMLPGQTSQLDKVMCGYTNRTGQLCGKCANGTSPPVYSYYPQCVICHEGTSNWLKYLCVSLIPTTIFFLLIVIIRFKATAPHMTGFIILWHLHQ